MWWATKPHEDRNGAVTVANQMPSLLFFQFTTICELLMSINHMDYFVWTA
jgi:hypothetical protein